MSSEFIGRIREIRVLQKRIERISSSGRGAAFTIRGRRQVGKSRLVQELCDRAGLPYCFWAASKGAAPALAVEDFVAALAGSSLGENAPIPSVRTGSWPDAFAVLASLLPDTPSIVVMDELPWAAEQDRAFDGALQTAWDRMLSNKPVLLLLLGSDLHMMERLTAYDRPFYGRADTLRLLPMNPAETAAATGLDGADAVDAHLLSGGLPGILRVWPSGMTALDFLRQECDDPASPLFGVPQQTLAAEFPAPDQTRRVLEGIGSGNRTRQNIAVASGSVEGGLPSGALSPILRRLATEKKAVVEAVPLSVRPGKPAVYRIADPNLQLYLAALRGAFELVERGHADQAFRLVQRRWDAWRGRAVEPLVRESLQIAGATGDLPWDGVETVGGWWNRQFDPELDLVGADRAPVAGRVFFVGSVKWLNRPFDRHDRDALLRVAPQVPGYDPDTTGLVVASRSGLDRRIDSEGIDLVWTPEELLSAWGDRQLHGPS
ncbi:ATP-binding protein [Glycomyces buryatensis]|uniref:ATP-binding protein n=1 Tax=Glycomyces buryatensis TaxID=2570927 RepID=A0A4S8QNY1_9ACTN|nr:ATP-binding protein [Glycomyces buryatensis]THV42414.1 ATP-binding protein [Glycomyces buryatensis]